MGALQTRANVTLTTHELTHVLTHALTHLHPYLHTYLHTDLHTYSHTYLHLYVLQEAGADSKLELAFTLADGIEYVRAAQAAGLEVNGHTYLRSCVYVCTHTVISIQIITHLINNITLTHTHTHTHKLRDTHLFILTFVISHHDY